MPFLDTTHYVVCPACEGSGATGGVRCPVCNGFGAIDPLLGRHLTAEVTVDEHEAAGARREDEPPVR